MSYILNIKNFNTYHVFFSDYLHAIIVVGKNYYWPSKVNRKFSSSIKNILLRTLYFMVYKILYCFSSLPVTDIIYLFNSSWQNQLGEILLYHRNIITSYGFLNGHVFFLENTRTFYLVSLHCLEESVTLECRWKYRNEERGLDYVNCQLKMEQTRHARDT